MATDYNERRGSKSRILRRKEPLYTYSRDRDGVHDVITIWNPQGEPVAELYFWDEPDTTEAYLADLSAQMVVTNLNRWYWDGTVVEIPFGESSLPPEKKSKCVRPKKGEAPT